MPLMCFSIHGAIIKIWITINVKLSDAYVVVSYGSDLLQKKHRNQEHVPSAIHRNGINQRRYLLPIVELFTDIDLTFY